MIVFDFVNNIIKGTKIPEPDYEVYKPFMVNRSLSQHWDTVLPANEMNIKRGITVEGQHAFLAGVISKKSRFSGKWAKTKKNSKVKVIQKIFGYSEQKAKEALEILTPEEYKEIVKSQPSEGGKGKRRIKV